MATSVKKPTQKYVPYDQLITTYWWNYGTKKKDFSGSIIDFMKQRNIKTSKVKHKTIDNFFGTKFKFQIGSTNFEIISFDFPNEAALRIVKTYLMYLGDRAQIVGIGRIIDINK